MKNQEEMRSIVTSVRLSEKQREEIQRKADMHNMTMGSFMVYSAMNANSGFDPVVAVRMQNILNIARELARKHQPELLDEIQKEEAAIWFMSN